MGRLSLVLLINIETILLNCLIRLKQVFLVSDIWNFDKVLLNLLVILSQFIACAIAYPINRRL